MLYWPCPPGNLRWPPAVTKEHPDHQWTFIDFSFCSLSSLPPLCFLGSPSKNLSSLQSLSLCLFLGATKLWHWVIGVISRSLQPHPLCPVWVREKVKVIHSCPTHFDSMNYTVHGILQARILEWVAFSFSSRSSHPGIEPRSPSLQADSLPAEPQGKPKNTGVGSLSLLQGIFPTQGLNPGLLHCSQILYQLSHKGSPISFMAACKLCSYHLLS